MRMIWKLVRALLLGVLALVVVALAVVFVLRFGDGPTAIVAGGPFTTGQPYAGEEPDWSFLKDRAEVQFQLLEPARSRTTWILEHDGRIYIPSGYMNSTLGKLWKHWPSEAERDGRARLRVDGVIYERSLVRVRESPALPYLAAELARKYLADPAAPPPDAAARQAMVDAVLQHVRDGSLWIFEMAPRS